MRSYGLVGYPLSHSFSKKFFTSKFEREGLSDCSYRNYEIPSINDLPQLLQSPSSISGLNVTIPYKEQVIPYLHWKNEIVEKTHACNCIRIRDGKLYGYNTDAIGFERSLRKNLRPHHQKALILGTGGAAKAVSYVLDQLGIEFIYLSRSHHKSNGTILTYDTLPDDVLQSHTLVINTTPLGLYPNVNEAPALKYELLTSRHHLYDAIYNPSKTLFLKMGEENGATIQNGEEMLIIQAEESWKIWNES